MKLYNDLTRKKEDFVPIRPGEVSIYSCGPTVYNFFHIGNARPFIMFDCLRRYFEYRGNRVNFVQNFTDVDDKIINRAREEGTTDREVSDRYIEEYFIDADGLGILRATTHPRVTETIPEIIDMVHTLVDKGHAYVVNGDVYYRTGSFKDYGKLSHQPIDELLAGARVDVSEQKQSPLDFVLWKASKPGEPHWDSPWGQGRPGWHIECSAMAKKYLGDTIDIHSGGQDLTFPHHENEIAQSEAANGAPFANYWLHNGYINVDNEKMSKSLGNFFTVRDVAKVYGYEPIRLFMLSAHYRSQINYSSENLEHAKAALERLYNFKNNLLFLLDKAPQQAPTEAEAAVIARLPAYRDKFIAAMDDDLNTADALSAVFELVRDVNTQVGAEGASSALLRAALELFEELCGVMGLCQGEAETLDDQVERLIEERQAARKARDFKAADAIRDQLLAQGIALEDTPQGVKWRRV
ncbi:MAG: cysteine--tRNA ligase [Clostridiales bacterium]|nr:cysteine--tRNA ligase [Clostridiales bacterium]